MDHLSSARAAKEKKKERKSIVHDKRSINIRRQTLNRKQNRIDQYFKPAHDSQKPTHNSLLDEMQKLENIKPKGRRYTSKFIMICESLFLTSFSCYVLLRKLGLPLVSPSHLMFLLRPKTRNNIKYLLNVSYVVEILNSYREENCQNKSDSLDVIIAVDAISFHPRIKIEGNSVKGIRGKQKIKDDYIRQIEESFSFFLFGI